MKRRKKLLVILTLAILCLVSVPVSAAALKRPAVPDLHGSAKQNVVTLTWTPVKNASGYKIYLYYSAHKEFRCVGDVSALSAFKLTLKGSNDRIYRYKIRAYNKKGKQILHGKVSDELQVKTAPKKPQITFAEKRSTTMNVISWKKIPSAEGYQILRAEKADGSYKKIGTVYGNQKFYFKDTRTQGKKWYYRVRAYRRNKESNVYGSYSEPKKAAERQLMVIGDSRTVMMEDAVGGDTIWIGKVSMGYAWLKDTAVKEAEKVLTSSTDVVIWLGVNDAHNISNYITFLNDLIPKWKAKGVRVYIMAVGQVEKDPYIDNKEIREFNSRMKAGVKGAGYIDLYSYLEKAGYKTLDGTHYDDATSRKIYAYMKKKIQQEKKT